MKTELYCVLQAIKIILFKPKIAINSIYQLNDGSFCDDIDVPRHEEEFLKSKNLNDNSMMKKRSITTSIFPKLNIPTSLKRKGGQKVDFERKAVIALMLQQRNANFEHEQCISESSKHDFA